MTIEVKDAGRRFNQEWIFRHFSYVFNAAGNYAILGPNGSGKSTLLSVILGNLSPSEGSVRYSDTVVIPQEKVYQQLSFAAPYVDLVEEFTLQETIDFHFKFKNLFPGLTQAAVLDILELSKAQDKPLKYFSSGMRQRTKLVLACCTDSPLLLLDEPTSNLDQQGIAWYQGLIREFTQQKLVLVGSNQENEYSFCENMIKITDYKA